MRRVGIDFKATAGATVLGLSGVLVYRYGIKPAISHHQELHAPVELNAQAAARKIEWESVQGLSSVEAVRQCRAVVLVARGYPESKVATLKAELEKAAAQQMIANDAQPLRFFLLEDSTPETPAEVLMAAISVTHSEPFLVILDRYGSTERRYLMTEKGIPSARDIARFINDFTAGKLKPARLGQPRPKNDRNERFPDIYEVVTDSFEDVVLDPNVDVILEGYTPKCDACKAFAPRWRMLAKLVEERYPGLLRVAAMNILDNDRPTEYMPEKWTPTMRLFPAHRKGDPQPPPGLRKRSLLLEYVEDEGSGMSAPKAVPLGESPASASDGSLPSQPAAPKVVLPTIPELLQWVAEHTGGRIALSHDVQRQAAEMESEAADIERAYAITLQFMSVWHQFASLAADEEEDRQAAASASVTSPSQPSAGLSSSSGTPEGRRDAQVSSELRKRIVDVYKFIQDEATQGTAPEIVRRMQTVSDIIARHQIMERLQSAAEAEEHAAAGFAAGTTTTSGVSASASRPEGLR